MIVRKLNQDGDWLYGGGSSDYLTENAAIAQSLKTRLKSFLGDCFFDLAAGVDWFNLLGGKNQLALNFNIKTVILNTADVVGVTEISQTLDRRTRLYTPIYNVQTVYPGGIKTGDLFLLGNLLTEMGDIITTEDEIPIGV